MKSSVFSTRSGSQSSLWFILKFGSLFYFSMVSLNWCAKGACPISHCSLSLYLLCLVKIFLIWATLVFECICAGLHCKHNWRNYGVKQGFSKLFSGKILVSCLQNIYFHNVDSFMLRILESLLYAGDILFRTRVSPVSFTL